MGNLGKAFVGAAIGGAAGTIASNAINNRRQKDPLKPGFFRRIRGTFWTMLVWAAFLVPGAFFSGQVNIVSVLLGIVVIALPIAGVALTSPELAQRVPRWVVGALPFAGDAVRGRERKTALMVRDIALPMLAPPEGVKDVDYYGNFSGGPSTVALLVPGREPAEFASILPAAAHQLGYELFAYAHAANPGWVRFSFANTEADLAAAIEAS